MMLGHCLRPYLFIKKEKKECHVSNFTSHDKYHFRPHVAVKPQSLDLWMVVISSSC